MQLQDLNKNQIVLLSILISFVTSIATGIMTVSLLQQAPVEVTRNINNVIEKTIQTVTPSVSTPTAQKEVTTTTVVVKEEDLILSSIDKNIKSVVRIKERNPLTNAIDFYGIGLVLTKEGLIAADRKATTNSFEYTAVMNDGTEVVVTPTGLDKQTNFIIFRPVKLDKAYIFNAVTLSDIEPRLGQTVIGLGGDILNAVAVGRVISLEMSAGSGTTTPKRLSDIDTDLSSKDLVNGSPSFNLSGDVIGVKLSSDAAKSFTPIAVLKSEMSLLLDAAKTQ
jgi:S1-C subfamily serine protease